MRIEGVYTHTRARARARAHTHTHTHTHIEGAGDKEVLQSAPDVSEFVDAVMSQVQEVHSTILN